MAFRPNPRVSDRRESRNPVLILFVIFAAFFEVGLAGLDKCVLSGGL
jgi:hypothetical protein